MPTLGFASLSGAVLSMAKLFYHMLKFGRRLMCDELQIDQTNLLLHNNLLGLT